MRLQLNFLRYPPTRLIDSIRLSRSTFSGGEVVVSPKTLLLILLCYLELRKYHPSLQQSHPNRLKMPMIVGRYKQENSSRFMSILNRGWIFLDSSYSTKGMDVAEPPKPGDWIPPLLPRSFAQRQGVSFFVSNEVGGNFSTWVRTRMT